MNKKIMLTILGLTALVTVGVIGSTVVKADWVGGTNPMAQLIAERFGLSEDEVAGVFDEMRTERHEQMMQAKQDRLNQAVSDGVITDAQKQALLNKWEEQQAEREQHRQEMQQWFTDQGIDPIALQPYMGFGRHGGFGHMQWK